MSVNAGGRTRLLLSLLLCALHLTIPAQAPFDTCLSLTISTPIHLSVSVGELGCALQPEDEDQLLMFVAIQCMKTGSSAKNKAAVRKFAHGGAPGEICFQSVKHNDIWQHKFVIHFIT